MAIDFGKTFGAQSNNNSNAPATAARPKAQFWLNVGYLTDQKDEEGNFKFVSLGTGIALDTMESLPTNSKNVAFAQFNAARNDLRDQLVAAMKQLKPGQAEYIGSADMPLQIQLRRVSEEVNQSAGEGNPFARKLGFSLEAAAS